MTWALGVDGVLDYAQASWTDVMQWVNAIWLGMKSIVEGVIPFVNLGNVACE